jgi:hypothetical protein
LQFFIYIFVFLAFDTFHVQYIEAKKVMIWDIDVGGREIID